MAQNNNIPDNPADESPLSSMEFDREELLSNAVYGTTPPSNQRALKRFKERVRSQNKKLTKADFKMVQERERIGKLQAARRSGGSQQEGNDSGDGTDGEEDVAFVETSRTKKRDPPKIYRNVRVSERDQKQRVRGTDVTTSLPVPSSLNLNTPNKFQSLRVKPLASPVGSLGVEEALPAYAASGERIKFSRDFVLLMNAVLTASVEKDRGMKVLRSEEQAMYQAQTNDLIWLNLQAWHHNRDLLDEDRYLSLEREKIDGVLADFITFRANPCAPRPGLPGLPRAPAPATLTPPAALHRTLSSQRSIIDDVQPMPPIPETHDDEHVDVFAQVTMETEPGGAREEAAESGILQNGLVNERPMLGCDVTLCRVVRAQQVAAAQVEAALGRLEQVEALYTTTKALGAHHQLYGTRALQRRVETLHLWLTVAQDVGRKLQLMAQVLRLDTAAVRWPWVSECDVLCDAAEEPAGEGGASLPATPCREAAGDAKNVRFDIDADVDDEMEAVTHGMSFLAPSDTSTPLRGTSRSLSMNSSMSRTSSSYSVDEYTKTSIYRYFVDRSLKRYGFKKMMGYINRMLETTLVSTYAALISGEPSTPVSSESPVVTSPVCCPAKLTVPSLLPNAEPVNIGDVLKTLSPDLLPFKEMTLPSVAPTYMFLLRIPLDLIHECLRLRLEQRPDEPSHMTVRQLIREYQELLRGAVQAKDWYAHMVAVATNQTEDYLDLDEYEDSLKSLFEVYVEYLQVWMMNLQRQFEMRKRLKHELETEWEFTKQICFEIRGGESHAANRFCLMTCSLLQSIATYLDQGMDECIDRLYNTTLGELEDAEEAELDVSERRNKSSSIRQGVGQACRDFRLLFEEARERASKALGFAKLLRKDLEIAAEFNIQAPLSDLYKKLGETGHMKVCTAYDSGYEMFVPDYVAKNQKLFLKLLNATCGRDGYTEKHEGYLICVRCGDEAEVCPLWPGATVDVKSTADISIALSHTDVQSLLLIVTNSDDLHNEVKLFESKVGQLLCRVTGHTSCHQGICDSLVELKKAATDLRDKIDYAVEQVELKLSLDNVNDLEKLHYDSIATQYKETLIQCYNFGMEYYMEVRRLLSGAQRNALYKHMVKFANRWMRFSMEKCDKGKGVKPRWASAGFNFLQQVCGDERGITLISEEEYMELKENINACISHIIGQPSNSTGLRPPGADGQRFSRVVSWPENRSASTRSLSTRSVQSEPPTPAGHRTELSTEGSGGDLVYEEVSPIQRVRSSVQEIEQERDARMQRERIVGRVTDRRDADYMHIDGHSMRRAGFKWQRGNKIGEGQYGKVYTAVNTQSGETMALKEIKFRPNDKQDHIQEICAEISILQSINHPGLVKYYGTEVHRSEMLIFMEYCDEGTIADVARHGLAEEVVRLYTRQLIKAVNALHEKQIAHRDIKGANIFLTSKGHKVKLGDFGCAVKLRDNTTQPGEMTKTAGTTAYMAPEVIVRKDVSAGRASDIWSLGCVVIEMITGKRPWHEYESNWQIMYRVGSGGTPATPEALSQEGKDFLSLCFRRDPKQRPSALDLLDHLFVKVDVDED